MVLKQVSHRQGPEASAAETPVGTLAKGNNGGYWMVIPVGGANSTRRWVQVKKDAKPKEFHTLTQGDSLWVVVGDKKAYVFYMDSHGVEGGWQLITGITYRRYWSSKGTWMVPPKRKPVPRAPKHTTVLLEVGFCRYTYIDGRQVAHFKTEAPVVDYDAPMGNGYMPYPFALTESRAYLLGEGKSIEWPWVETETPSNPKHTAKIPRDPYDVFYFKPTVSTKTFPWYVVYDAWDTNNKK